jgi:hypothetical protein
MSKLFNISGEERERIKFLHETKNPHAVIVEIGFGGVANALAAQAKPKSEEQKIADGILRATQGAGTNEKNLLFSINKFKDQAQFWNVNSFLKGKTGEDFAGIINGELGRDDGSDVQTIIDKLKTIGLTAIATIDEYNQFVENTFKITGAAKAAAPKKGGTVRQGGQSTANLQQRFQKSQSNLGIKGGTGKMDLETLQTILKTLEGGSVVPAAGGTPDMAKLTASLNTLNQG